MIDQTLPGDELKKEHVASPDGYIKKPTRIPVELYSISILEMGKYFPVNPKATP